MSDVFNPPLTHEELATTIAAALHGMEPPIERYEMSTTDTVHEDPKFLLAELESGSIDPIDVGLLLPRTSLVSYYREQGGDLSGRLSATVKEATYTQRRVAIFGRNGVEEADIVKAKTMNELTEDGKLFKKILDELLIGGDTTLNTKRIGAWRVRTLGQKIMRAVSIDEATQLIFNVWNLPGAPSEDLLPMSFIGSNRPPLAYEIGIGKYGYDEYDPFCRALTEKAEEYGFEDRYTMYNFLGANYEPAAFTYAGATGHRQLNNSDDFGHMIDSMMYRVEMRRRHPSIQGPMAARILAGNAFHILKRTDAA